MKKKYFKQCLICSFIILSVLFSSLVIIGYAGIKSNIHQSEKIKFYSEFEKKQKNFENAVNISIALGQYVLSNENARTYANDSSYYNNNDFYAITSIFNLLRVNQVAFSSMNIDISVFKEISDIVINPNSTMSKNDFENKYSIKTKYITDSFSKNIASGYYYSVTSNPPENNNIYVIGQYIYPSFAKAYVCITISRDKVKYIPDYVKNKALLIYGNTDENNSDNSFIKSINLTDSYTYNKESNNGKTISLYSMPKSIPNIILSSSYDYPAHNMLIFALLAALIIVNLMAAAISYFISKVIYKPIKSLMQIFVSDDDEYESENENEIEYISNYASMIINTNETLSSKIDSQSAYLKHKFIFDLLNGFIWGDAIVNNIKNFDLFFLEKPCNAILIKNVKLLNDDVTYITPQILSAENQSIFNIIKDHLLKDISGIGITLENNEFLFVMSESERNKQNLLEAINDVKKETGLSFKGFISAPIKSIDEYKYVYSNLTSMCEHVYLYGDLDIITDDLIKPSSITGGIYTLKEEQHLVEYIMSNEYEKGLLYLNQLVERVSALNLSDSDYDIFKSMMINTVQRLCSAADKSADDLFGENDVYQKLLKCTDRDEFQKSIISVFKTLARSIHADITSQYNRITDEILSYINSHLADDISMDEISMEFKISKSTVARRLKERNILFKAYVNEQRIEKAKEIMRNNPNKMIKDIAFETGFVNVVSFNRLFKKYELISPKQYQDNLKRK